MINFKRDGKKAVVRIDLSVPEYEERSFPFAFNCDGEVYAGLLTRAMRTAFSDAVKAARKEGYDQGWKDAKAKRASCSWFKGSL